MDGLLHIRLSVLMGPWALSTVRMLTHHMTSLEKPCKVGKQAHPLISPFSLFFLLLLISRVPIHMTSYAACFFFGPSISDFHILRFFGFSNKEKEPPFLFSCGFHAFRASQPAYIHPYPFQWRTIIGKKVPSLIIGIHRISFTVAGMFILIPPANCLFARSYKYTGFCLHWST